MRSDTRSLGLNRLVGSLITNRKYEDHYGPALHAASVSG